MHGHCKRIPPREEQGKECNVPNSELEDIEINIANLIEEIKPVNNEIGPIESKSVTKAAIMLRMGRRLVMKKMMRFVRMRQIRDESGDNAAHGKEIGMKSDRL